MKLPARCVTHLIACIGGMKWFAGKMDRIKEITVPFYQNEITLRACIRRSEFADAPMFNEITLFKEGNGGNFYMSEKGKYIMEFIQHISPILQNASRPVRGRRMP